MTSRFRLHQLLLISVTLVALGAAACSSEPVSVIAGADDEVGEGANDVADDSAHPADTTIVPIDNDTSVDFQSPDDLLGSAWIIESVDGTTYEGDAALSFYGEPGELSFSWIDECSTGRGHLQLRNGAYVFFNGGGPNNACIGHPTSLFPNEQETEELDRYDISLDDGILAINNSTHSLRATHYQSHSMHDRPLPLPGLSYPDLVQPDIIDYSTIDEATKIPFPECPSEGRIGLEDDPHEEEHLAASQRLSQVSGALPFVVWSSAAGGNLRHHEAGLGLSVRYQPTIDWLAANFAPEDLCLDLPPSGYYDAPPTLIPWKLSGEELGDGMSVEIVRDIQCDYVDSSRLLEPQIEYTADEIRIGLPLMLSPFGQSSVGMCLLPQPFVVMLTEPADGRDIVPATGLLK